MNIIKKAIINELKISGLIYSFVGITSFLLDLMYESIEFIKIMKALFTTHIVLLTIACVICVLSKEFREGWKERVAKIQ